MPSLKSLAARLGSPFSGDYAFDRAIIDSRRAKPGTLFFALSGMNTDGHRFVPDVLGEGGAAVVSRSGFTGPVLEVDSVPEALLEAGKWARESMEFPVVGVTGSNGKTTTRRMMACALSQKYAVSETRGNLNNHLGLPLTLLNTPEGTEILVLEMGMNHSGELLRLGWAASPHHAVVTNIARAHMEFFPELSHVAKAKAELLKTTVPGGMAIIPAGEEILEETALERGLQVVTHGEGGDCWLEERTAMPWGVELNLRFHGIHNYRNALVALCFAKRMGVDPSSAAAALSGLNPAAGRGRIVTVDHRRILDESYNANPDSTRACLKAASAFSHPLVAVLGDMLELGEKAPDYHLQVLKMADNLGFEKVITVGKNYLAAAKASGLSCCVSAVDWSGALEIVRGTAPEGATILVKGSNSIALRLLVESLEREGF